MRVLLQADIAKLGYYGDVVEVKAGYARNYLLPQRLAIEPTEANVKAIESERARRAEERRLAQEQLVKAAARADGAEITIPANANEQGHLFGSVTEDAIASSLREKGLEVQNQHVVLPEHLRVLGSHPVKLLFARGVEANITVHIVRPEEPASESEPESENAGRSE